MSPRPAARLAPVVLLCDHDLRTKDEYCRNADAELRKTSPDLNVRRYYGAETGAGAILAECNSFSLLGGKNLVIVTDAEKVFLKGDKRSEGPAKLLAGYLASPNPDTVLILKTDEVLKKLPAGLITLLRESGKVIECKSRPADHQQELRERFAAAGQRVEPAAIQRLAELIEFDSSGLQWCLEQLRSAAAGGTVTLAAVEQALAGEGEGNLWGFVDAIGDRRRDALAGLRFLIRDEEPIVLLGCIRKRVRDLALIRELQAQGRTPALIGKALGGGRAAPWLLEKLQRQASRYTLAELRRALRGLAELDYRLKSTGTKQPEILFERWLAELLLFPRALAG